MIRKSRSLSIVTSAVFAAVAAITFIPSAIAGASNGIPPLPAPAAASAKTIPTTSGGVSPLCSTIEAESAYEEDAFGVIAGVAQLWYNQCTRNVWATNANYLSQSCSGGNYTDPGCGGNEVERDDGAYKQCWFQSVGQRTCTTSQIYDGGYVSYAYGTIWDYSGNFYAGQTAQF